MASLFGQASAGPRRAPRLGRRRVGKGRARQPSRVIPSHKPCSPALIFVCSNAGNGTLCLWRSRRRRHAGLVSSRVIAGDRIDAEFLADMGELFRIGEAVIHHHRSQRRQASLGEE